MNIVILLVARHANTKAESIVIILFLLTVFSVFIMKTCTDFSPSSLSKQKFFKRKNLSYSASLYMQTSLAITLKWPKLSN